MATKKKRDKTPKPRPDKYAEKVAINATFDEAIHLLAQHANKVVEDRQNEPAVSEPTNE
jgi:hypothetical protein